MGQFAMSLVSALPQQRVPLYQHTPYCVLLENSDHESEAHARDLFERLLEAAMVQGCVSDAVVAESITQARALWHIRESIPLAQAEEGLNIKHDISIPVSQIPDSSASPTPCWRRPSPAPAGQLRPPGDGNLHYNVQAPEGADAAAFLNEQESGRQRAGVRSVDQFNGSISADTRGQPQTRQTGTAQIAGALGLMRAIKKSLDPLNLMNRTGDPGLTASAPQESLL